MKTIPHIAPFVILTSAAAVAQNVHFDVKYAPPHVCERSESVPVAVYIYYHPGLNVSGDAPEPQLVFAHWMDGLTVSRLLDCQDAAVGLLSLQEPTLLAGLLESSPLAETLAENQIMQGSAIYVVRHSGSTYRKTAIPCSPARGFGLAVGLSAALSLRDAREWTSSVHRQVEASTGWCPDFFELKCRKCDLSMLRTSVGLSLVPHG